MGVLLTLQGMLNVRLIAEDLRELCRLVDE
jgi:hypothetical protein